jgi:hypothetical protein
MAKDYTSSLNLPKTEFSMKANLPQREPETLKYWESIDLYNKMVATREGNEKFTFHDGPPFSNGNIHMGHALNKILKDFINKYKSMSGYKISYVPGWDNHGMPIESAIIKKNKLDRKKMSVSEFRTACQHFAQDFVDKQADQFQNERPFQRAQFLRAAEKQDQEKREDGDRKVQVCPVPGADIRRDQVQEPGPVPADIRIVEKVLCRARLVCAV